MGFHFSGVDALSGKRVLSYGTILLGFSQAIRFDHDDMRVENYCFKTDKHYFLACGENGQGDTLYSLKLPNGEVVTFKETIPDEGLWMAPGQALGDTSNNEEVIGESPIKRFDKRLEVMFGREVYKNLKFPDSVTEELDEVMNHWDVYWLPISRAGQGSTWREFQDLIPEQSVQKMLSFQYGLQTLQQFLDKLLWDSAAAQKAKEDWAQARLVCGETYDELKKALKCWDLPGGPILKQLQKDAATCFNLAKEVFPVRNLTKFPGAFDICGLLHLAAVRDASPAMSKYLSVNQNTTPCSEDSFPIIEIDLDKDTVPTPPMGPAIYLIHESNKNYKAASTRLGQSFRVAPIEDKQGKKLAKLMNLSTTELRSFVDKFFGYSFRAPYSYQLAPFRFVNVEYLRLLA
eukprot:Protomagalhaensia_wolfi_Nauph_80__1285@NODE_1761_length_1356_cov_25_397115_g1369_i0_p1_GENE_NODE_1761_length_1356_cov_25_397115_g1369_i0NODE_1761_length_1356_cov_25_397115_g1369_i0_p1_ORF_typecomplete_len403_score65_46_NODE_1761_length_1356_cov_25_397115_g1369_i01021310